MARLSANSATLNPPAVASSLTLSRKPRVKPGERREGWGLGHSLPPFSGGRLDECNHSGNAGAHEGRASPARLHDRQIDFDTNRATGLRPPSTGKEPLSLCHTTQKHHPAGRRRRRLRDELASGQRDYRVG